ncbi:uncharacterized protein BDCG_05226 [Blastomyces dermatitidis ER-3]|uniref:Uncharacterized protein n=1 Tax=Ajellomyces dermatitidis (strain ER-3 / ATCC MYA-2586) TaxID=559297 RepID=A0ABP2F3M6_AJEDR|nr:uncharacterized protein BDCG_05226 [Blastomyces dermatitidis ER-3]EEQ90106.1 hypothetical protein BDCG_05226 [Blastomyces dermatitidis ER-3]
MPRTIRYGTENSKETVGETAIDTPPCGLGQSDLNIPTARRGYLFLIIPGREQSLVDRKRLACFASANEIDTKHGHTHRINITLWHLRRVAPWGLSTLKKPVKTRDIFLAMGTESPKPAIQERTSCYFAANEHLGSLTREATRRMTPGEFPLIIGFLDAEACILVDPSGTNGA